MTVPPVPPPPPSAPPPAAGGTVSPNRSLMIVLSYLWILAVVPLIVEKDDREVQWHAKHGLVLLVAELILWVAIFVVQMILSHVLVFLGCAVGILSIVLWIGVLIVHIVAIMKGVNGQRFIIPGVSQYVDRF